MYTSSRLLWLLAAALLLQAPAWSAPDCRPLREQRDQLAGAAMQAEIALLRGIRQRICPSQEAIAVEANALAASQAGGAPLDYTAYIRCREQAEAQLQRSRPVLYRNRRGFTYYTQTGADLAREADGLQERLERACPSPSR
jgi:hypothetical protein